MQNEIRKDIREYKTNLRTKYKSIRKSMSIDKKKCYDNDIYNKVISLKAYKKSKIVLTYVSTDIEVDTIQIINHSLREGKIVAVPKCIKGTRNMRFYVIKSLDDLEVATFSVLEPKIDICQEIIDFDNAFCIVPGLVFDLKGYRLGYGKGYYDRFLDKSQSLNKIGLCYCSCTVNSLIYGKFDVPVDIIVTEKYTRIIGG